MKIQAKARLLATTKFELGSQLKAVLNGKPVFLTVVANAKKVVVDAYTPFGAALGRFDLSAVENPVVLADVQDDLNVDQFSTPADDYQEELNTDGTTEVPDEKALLMTDLPVI